MNSGPKYSVKGNISAGVASFNNLNIGASHKTNDGIFLAIEGEKSINQYQLYAVGMINHMRTTGSTNYSYSNSFETYNSDNVSFDMSVTQIGAGLRLRIIETSWVSPYVEIGGTGGYLQLNYENAIQRNSESYQSSAQKNFDGTFEFGTYAQAGIDFVLSRDYGARLSHRYMNMTTRELVTMGNQSLNYTAAGTYASFVFKF